MQWIGYDRIHMWSTVCKRNPTVSNMTQGCLTICPKGTTGEWGLAGGEGVQGPHHHRQGEQGKQHGLPRPRERRGMARVLGTAVSTPRVGAAAEHGCAARCPCRRERACTRVLLGVHGCRGVSGSDLGLDLAAKRRGEADRGGVVRMITGESAGVRSSPGPNMHATGEAERVQERGLGPLPVGSGSS
jgi:hypothetical protein